MDDNKSKALAAALVQIEKQFGKGSIMRLGESQVQNDLQVVSPGSLGLDKALGGGGLPRGSGEQVRLRRVLGGERGEAGADQDAMFRRRAGELADTDMIEVL